MTTLVLVNGRIWTADSSQPDAEAVAIAGDRIAHVGTTSDVMARAGGAEVVDLQGQFVVPGFIDPGGWVPEQRITVDEALAAYTRAGAHASFEERDKGTIATGMLADLTVIDRDLRSIPPPEIRDARIVRTVVGGRTVFAAAP